MPARWRAIDATPARWRGDAGSSPRPTHWLISTQFFQRRTDALRRHTPTLCGVPDVTPRALGHLPAGHGARGAVRLRHITDGSCRGEKAAPVVLARDVAAGARRRQLRVFSDGVPGGRIRSSSGEGCFVNCIFCVTTFKQNDYGFDSDAMTLPWTTWGWTTTGWTTGCISTTVAGAIGGGAASQAATTGG